MTQFSRMALTAALTAVVFGAGREARSADDGSQIDLMVVYSSAARTAWGDTALLESMIRASVSDLNTAFTNSGVSTQLRLVHLQEVPYTATIIPHELVEHLIDPADGVLDQVPLLRNTHKADLVHMVHMAEGCGDGTVLPGRDAAGNVRTNFAAFSEEAYSVTHPSCTRTYLQMGHAIGHNLGVQHALGDAEHDGGVKPYPYSYGYKDPQNRFRDIMAEDCPAPGPGGPVNGENCPRVLMYSTTTRTYNGMAIGVADQADAARSINNVRVIVANFRQLSGTTPTATPTPPPAGDIAQVTSPAPGSSITTSTVTFSWSSGTGVSEYWLSVGYSTNGSQLWGGSVGTARSQTVSGIPTDGRAIYVRLESLKNGSWQSSYATYNTGATPPPTATPTPGPTSAPTATPTPGSDIAVFVSPAPGSNLTSSTVTFQWSPGTGVSEYWLSIGTTQGGSQLFGGSTGTATSRTVSGIPIDGRTIYARIQSFKNGAWPASSATYGTGGSATATPTPAPTSAPTATPTPAPTPSDIAVITSPTPGSKLASSTVTFTWSAGTGVSEYWLSVGTTLNGSQLWGGSTGTMRSVTVSGLPTDGRTVYVRIQSSKNGAWPSSYAQYSTGP
jgi:hypothetical protein